ncbi:DUF6461 domain-containing protein [Streptomyces sp. NPDC004788]
MLAAITTATDRFAAAVTLLMVYALHNLYAPGFEPYNFAFQRLRVRLLRAVVLRVATMWCGIAGLLMLLHSTLADEKARPFLLGATLTLTLALSEASGTLRRMVTAHDYDWIRTSPLFRHMMESGYTLTLIRGRSPQEVLCAMEAEPRGTGEGAAGLIEADDAHRAEVDDDYWNDSYVAGAFKVPGEKRDWTVVLGFDGGLGLPCAEALSEGGRVVAHSSNGGKPIHLFRWFEDGELRTTFEGPSARDGSSPNELVPLLREVGFPLTPGGEHDESAPVVDGKAAVLALAERLTGIRVTESLLQDATYELGLVPERSAEEWTGLVIDITDAHGERLYKEWTYEEIAAASERARVEANAPIVMTYNEPIAKDPSEHETGE